MHVKSNLDFIQIGLRVREIRKAAHLKPGEFGEIVGVGDRQCALKGASHSGQETSTR